MAVEAALPAAPRSIHATGVAIDGGALLICGPSRSGKSQLALALVAASTRDRTIRLIGDDRILLRRVGGALVARAHPRIAGFIERRGLGIVAMPFLAAAPVVGIVALSVEVRSADAGGVAGENFPVLSLVDVRETHRRRDMVLDWWNQGKIATSAPHPPEKPQFQRAPGRKD